MAIYFDYNATTPLDPDVRAAMAPFLGGNFGNPSSVHQIGRAARAALDDAHDRVATRWRCKPSEVVFTSGGTESNNLAIFGAARLLRNRGRHLITSLIEHHAVLNCFEYLERQEGFAVTYLPVDREGRIDPDDLKRALRPDTILVSLMAANNEVGTIEPVAELGRICHARGVVFHTDAVQWFGKEPVATIHQFEADLVSCCAHKFHGPKGAGVLFIRSPLQPTPILFGGGHEHERRAGTENLAAIAGCVVALERFLSPPVFAPCARANLWAPIREALAALPSCSLVSPLEGVLSNTLSFAVDKTDGLTLLANLDLAGFCASSGSACSAGSLNPSHVLRAMGYPPHLAASLVRLSLGRESTLAQTAHLSAALPNIIRCSQTPD